MDDILIKLKSLKPELSRQFGINEIAVFGSYAKGEQTEDSDIDILIMDMERKNGITIVKAQNYLSEALEISVDIGLYDSLRHYIKTQVENDLLYV